MPFLIKIPNFLRISPSLTQDFFAFCFAFWCSDFVSKTFFDVDLVHSGWRAQLLACRIWVLTKANPKSSTSTPTWNLEAWDKKKSGFIDYCSAIELESPVASTSSIKSCDLDVSIMPALRRTNSSLAACPKESWRMYLDSITSLYAAFDCGSRQGIHRRSQEVPYCHHTSTLRELKTWTTWPMWSGRL